MRLQGVRDRAVWQPTLSELLVPPVGRLYIRLGHHEVAGPCALCCVAWHFQARGVAANIPRDKRYFTSHIVRTCASTLPVSTDALAAQWVSSR